MRARLLFTALENLISEEVGVGWFFVTKDNEVRSRVAGRNLGGVRGPELPKGDLIGRSTRKPEVRWMQEQRSALPVQRG
jgi:hypothetical protein